MTLKTGSLIKIDGVALPGLKSYKVGYNKLWRDAERNMNGDVRATLVGIFPKIELEFRPAMNETQISQVSSLLAKPYFSVTYYDMERKQDLTAQFYAGDYSIPVLNRDKGYFDGFTVSLIAVSKR